MADINQVIDYIEGYAGSRQWEIEGEPVTISVPGKRFVIAQVVIIGERSFDLELISPTGKYCYWSQQCHHHKEAILNTLFRKLLSYPIVKH